MRDITTSQVIRNLSGRGRDGERRGRDGERRGRDGERSGGEVVRWREEWGR